MALSERALTLQRRVSHPLLMRLWMLAKLPAAWFCGVGLSQLTEKHCLTTVPYGWRSQNPFRSTYFAAQAMAAELSTGALVMLAIENSGQAFSMLIVETKATFGKKATALATFSCESGDAIFAAIQAASETGEAQQVSMESVGRLADGTEVSRFVFTWSVKKKQSR